MDSADVSQNASVILKITFFNVLIDSKGKSRRKKTKKCDQHA